MMTITLKTENKEFELKNYQSPIGTREGNFRPHLVKIECNVEFTQLSLARHIQYLTDIYAAMQSGCKHEFIAKKIVDLTWSPEKAICRLCGYEP